MRGRPPDTPNTPVPAAGPVAPAGSRVWGSQFHRFRSRRSALPGAGSAAIPAVVAAVPVVIVVVTAVAIAPIVIVPAMVVAVVVVAIVLHVLGGNLLRRA